MTPCSCSVRHRTLMAACLSLGLMLSDHSRPKVWNMKTAVHGGCHCEGSFCQCQARVSYLEWWVKNVVFHYQHICRYQTYNLRFTSGIFINLLTMIDTSMYQGIFVITGLENGLVMTCSATSHCLNQWWFTDNQTIKELEYKYSFFFKK